VSQWPVKVLPDGTRVYSNGTKYKPMAAADRKRNINKPDVEGAVLFGSRWVVPIVVLDDDKREPVPETRSDEEGYDHTLYCGCVICKRPAVDAVKWRRYKPPPKRARS